jgi:hypothetical protein
MALRRIPTMLLICQLLGCSGPKTYTFEVALTTNNSLWTNTLWRPSNSHYGKFVRDFSIRIPQNFYIYRDNHQYKDQTTIGLALNKDTFNPISLTIARTEHIDLSKLSWSDPNPLDHLFQAKPYRKYLLNVTIMGRKYGSKVIRPSTDSNFTKLFQFFKEDSGYLLYLSKGQPQLNKDLLKITGYSKSGRTIRMFCLSSVNNCSFDFDYKSSTVTMVLPREDMGQSQALVNRVVRFLDQSNVP